MRGATVTCAMQNLSSMDSAEFTKVSAAFRDELQQRGVKTVDANAAAALVVSVTQNPTEYLGVVQIRRNEDTQTLMEGFGERLGPPEAESAFDVTLHRELLFAQDSAVLDVVFAGDGKVLFALGPAEIASYQRSDDGGWARTSAERLPRKRAPERNERGYLFFGTDVETASFPGEVCRNYAASGKGWNCEGTRGEAAPVRPVADADLAGKKTGRWISAARFETNGKTSIVLTGADGAARLYGDGADPVATFLGWGSELASVHSGCGGRSGWQVLRTGLADWTKPDTLQAMEIKDARAEAASTAIEFPGAITALHTPGTRGDEDSQQSKVIAVARNLQTGRYDVYLLSVICAN